MLKCILLLAVGVAAAGEAPTLRWSVRVPVAPPWPTSQDRLTFDRAPAPVVAGDMVLVASSGLDALLALDAATGGERWRFACEGPPRLPPACDGTRVFLGSDDGRVYGLDLASGRERWRREPPARRLVLGNGRLISTWPVRGGPVVADGTLYVASGLYGFMGTFIAALDPATGAERWCASGDGSGWNVQQHFSPAFAGIAPQGSLVVAGDLVLVPGGRTPPAAYDRATGALRWQRLSDRIWDKGLGSSQVTVAGGMFVTTGGVHRIEDGQPLCPVANGAVDTDTLWTVGTDRRLYAWALPPVVVAGGGQKKAWNLTERWKVAVDPAPVAVATAAGGRVYGWSAQDEVLAFAVDAQGARLAWRQKVVGTPRTITVAGERILVGTAEGWLHCLANGTGAAVVRDLPPSPPADAGWALVLGGAGSEAGALHPVICEPDAARAAALRGRLAGRATILNAAAADAGLPPYFADRVVAGAAATPQDVAAALHCLRPGAGRAQVAKVPDRLPPGCTPGGDGIVRGLLPGAGSWTHQYGDAAQRVVSDDTLVRAPLGLLWFGGPPNDEVLPRHGHGPNPLVLGNRLFIEGRDMVRAVDIYTGRLLWQTDIKGLGVFYDNTSHQPGANEIGSNLAVAEDALYAMATDGVRVLDAATGAERLRIGQGLRWGAISLCQDLLVARLDPVQVTTRKKLRIAEDEEATPPSPGDVAVDAKAPYGAASRILAVFDRRTGSERWRRPAQREFRHNAMAIGRGRIFIIDAATAWRQSGSGPGATLLALDAATGKEAWRSDDAITGTWLGYSAEHDALLEAGSSSRDRALDEVGRGMAVRQGGDGRLLWRHDQRYAGPALIRQRTIYTQPSSRPAGAWDLLTGQAVALPDPVTGAEEPWQLTRNYGCNTMIGSENLFTYRSASAAFHDLLHPWGTASLGGFKSGCSSNLIAAGGILNAPDYTRTCTCGYQIQASLALIHDPLVETWSLRGATPIKGRIDRLGINFGAPGDRVDDEGIPWLAWPSPAKLRPVAVAIEPVGVRYRRQHSLLAPGPLAWVAASEATGVQQLQLPLGGDGTYTVRVVMNRPHDGIRINGAALPVGAGRIRELRGVAVKGTLTVTWQPAGDVAGVAVIRE